MEIILSIICLDAYDTFLQLANMQVVLLLASYTYVESRIFNFQVEIEPWLSIIV